MSHHERLHLRLCQIPFTFGSLGTFPPAAKQTVKKKPQMAWDDLMILLMATRNPANQSRLVDSPIIYKALFIPEGAEFLPSTVLYHYRVSDIIFILLNRYQHSALMQTPRPVSMYTDPIMLHVAWNANFWILWGNEYRKVQYHYIDLYSAMSA